MNKYTLEEKEILPLSFIQSFSLKKAIELDKSTPVVFDKDFVLIFQIAESISLPTEEKGLKIQKLLERNGVKIDYIENIGLVKKSNKIGGPDKIFTCHYDNVSFFDLFFEDSVKNNKKDAFFINEDFQKLYGLLDNTFVNAILIYLMIKNKEHKYFNDSEFVFTLYEENGSLGAKNYMNNIYSRYQNKEEAFFINLDVTNYGTNYGTSIEYDYPKNKIVKKLNKCLVNHKIQFIRTPDDLSVILNYTKKGFSASLPSFNEIHSLRNYALIKTVKEYIYNIEALITKFKS